MRILLDENLPADLAGMLSGHRVDTVAGAGWAGIRNGTLLRLAASRYEAFITMDSNIQHQQNLAQWKLPIIVLRAPSNRMLHLKPLIPAIVDALRKIKSGQLLSVGS